jgi:putative two-component system response regulator
VSLIYPGISNERNLALLEDDLDEHRLLPNHESRRLGASDLCLVDAEQFQRLREAIREEKKRSEPIFWPVILFIDSDRRTKRPIIEESVIDEIVEIPVKSALLKARINNLLERRSMSRELADYNQNLESKVHRRTQDLQEREEEIIHRLVSASQYRDQETGGHIRRLGLYAEQMAEELGWEGEPLNNIRLAAMMHDVGKLGIPDDVLQKPGDLTDEEFETMKDHSVIGAEILQDSDVPPLQMAETVARYHHEQWDGSGYPAGLAGEDIPESARIVSVIDVYDALVHDRVYRDAMPEQKVLDIIDEDSGTHFDPEMVDCFFEVLPSLRAIRQLNPEELDDAV